MVGRRALHLRGLLLHAVVRVYAMGHTGLIVDEKVEGMIVPSRNNPTAWEMC